MSTTQPQHPKTGPQDFNVGSSKASAFSVSDFFYVCLYSPNTSPNGPSSYALGHRARWGTGSKEAHTTIYIGCAPGTAGRAAGTSYRQTNIAAEKAARKAERADV
ncbi:hypothetical protein DSL72_005607 [Monilinia vaccinii-corymbosi]|uniref:Uncharacterized protein n=1 Tax=Monilinia vaccinii-corymbosi TaxID=61207 RepID=A0A8A3PFL7_9HELO|nr:hypothetical protein DSL72_005607 [Monilinia vaccinii-corymbosi]